MVDTWDRFRADDKRGGRRFDRRGQQGRSALGATSRPRLPVSSRLTRPLPTGARPVAVDKHLQSHHRSDQRRRLRRRPGVGVLDRTGDRRRARHVRGDVPAVEHGLADGGTQRLTRILGYRRASN